MLIFPCSTCGATIQVKHLAVGEQALCRACGAYQAVPNTSTVSEGEPDYVAPPPGRDSTIRPEEKIEEPEIDAGPPDPELIAAVREGLIDYQKKSGGALKNLIWLIVTVAFFMVVASYGWTFESLVIIVIVLFVHEMGHLLGMKYFGYRNVRMFFIPMFGAAVSGRQSGAESRHAMVVSLLGPVPGIVIGIAAGAIALEIESELLMKYATASLFINAFNLLPMMPLDGGRLVADGLFAGRARGRQITTIVGGVLLAVLAIMLRSPLLGVVAFITVISSFANGGNEARILAALKGSRRFEGHYHEEAPPAEFIRLATSLVSQHLKDAYRRQKHVTELVVGAWDRFRTRPAGTGTSTGLLFVGFLSFIVGLASFASYSAQSYNRNFAYLTQPMIDRLVHTYESGDQQHFMALCDSLPARMTERPQIQKYRGFVLLRQQRYDSAIAALRVAAISDSTPVDVYLGLASAFRAVNRQDSALEYYLRSADLRPDLPGAHYGAMMAAFATGDVGLAVQQAEQYRRLSPDDPASAVRLALLHHSLGNDGVRDSLIQIANIRGYDRMDELNRLIESGNPITAAALDTL